MKHNPLERNGTLVLGAGELGSAVIREFVRLRARRPHAPIKVLLRPLGEEVASGSRDWLRDDDVEVLEADLASAGVEELAQIFSRFSQIICCTGFVGGAGTQRRITEAVLRAEVDHYIPWQFGVDYDVVGRGSGQPVWDEQLDVREMLRSQDRVRWTIVSTGIFTGFVFLPEFGVVDLSGGTITALGDWAHRLTATTAEDIARMTALVAVDPDAFADRIVRISGDTFSYRELADIIDRVLGRCFERRLLDENALRAAIVDAPDDLMARYRLAFARPDGVAWPIEVTLNAERGAAMVDTATWLRNWRDETGISGGASTTSREQALCIARPETLVASAEPDSASIVAVTQRYYASWNADAEDLLQETVSSTYVDHTPPPGRTPDLSGLATAQRAFRTAFPDGRVHVLEQIVTGDRVVSHLRVTGRFLGSRGGLRGHGQRIDYRATDIMRLSEGRIVANWHVEDHETMTRQLG